MLGKPQYGITNILQNKTQNRETKLRARAEAWPDPTRDGDALPTPSPVAGHAASGRVGDTV